MQKTILLTGATDGIGLETARLLAIGGHQLLLHGRNPDKLRAVRNALTSAGKEDRVETFVADLSRMSDVRQLADAVAKKHDQLDVLINNAGVFKTHDPTSTDGLDVRFVVNTIAPYVLTQQLLPRLGPSARVVNLSSAAQAPVNLEALAGKVRLTDMDAYAQSKLALTMWSRHLAISLQGKGPAIIAINPGSLLATKMVKEGFGVAGKDIRVGADILVRAALSDEFANASGKYFDNDTGRFNSPHPDALDDRKNEAVVQRIDELVTPVL